MNATSEMIRHSRASACVECGKCSAACSMAAMYPDFSGAYSPRGLVQQALRQAKGQQGANGGADAGSSAASAGLVDAAYLWRCLQCGNCSLTCPEGVDPAGLIATLRAVAAASGQGTQARCCVGCGRDMPALPVQTWLDNMLGADGTQRDLDPEETMAKPAAYRALCSVCRRQAYAANNAAG